jgi:hypothetical protein
MFVFSTVLFVNGLPVAYQVFKEYRLVFKPAAIGNIPISAPVLFAEKKNHNWIITGTTDANLKAQAIEDIQNNEHKLAAGHTA